MRLLPRWTALGFVLLMGLSALAAASAPPVPTRKGRQTLVLDGTWKFLTDPQGSGETAGRQRSIPTNAADTAVPDRWSTVAAPGYNGQAWYWREVDIPPTWKGQTIRLCFGAAANSATVWVNGDLQGEHAGSVTPFDLNITKSAKIGARNLIAVRVQGEAKSGAGLWQGVRMVSHDEAYIDDCFAQTDGIGHVNAIVAFLNTSQNSGDAELMGRISTSSGASKDIRNSTIQLHLTPGRNLATLLLTLKGKPLHLWTPASPTLYYLQLRFMQAKDILDTQETAFGFREFGVKDGQVTLNGESVSLVSAPRSGQLPVTVTTADTDRAREALRRLKAGGVNTIHLEAPPAGLLRLADEEGLLVVESARPHRDPARSLEELHALIVRDRSHPSVIAWDLHAADNAVAKEIRQMDPTRFLLAGLPGSVKLWLPNQNEATSAAIPPGLTP